MRELAPGLRHWTAQHPNIGAEVSSYALVDEGVLLNPLLPEGEDPIAGVRVTAVVLTNRHHVRSAERFGVPVHAPAVGLADVQGIDADVRGYADGDELPGGLRARQVGVLSPDEFALLAPAHRAVAVADGVVDLGDGLAVVPDELLGDDPRAIAAGLHEAFGRLAEEVDFDHLLLAHGPPVVGEGRAALRAFAAG